VQEIFPFSKTSIPAVGPTQLFIQYVPQLLPKVKQPGHEVQQSPPSGSEVKNE